MLFFRVNKDEDYGLVHFYIEIPEDTVKVAKALKNMVYAAYTVETMKTEV